MSTTTPHSLPRGSRLSRLQTAGRGLQSRYHRRPQHRSPDGSPTIPVMGPANRAPGTAIMGGPDSAERLSVMGGPDAGLRLHVMGRPDDGPRVDVMGESDPRFTDWLFSARSPGR